MISASTKLHKFQTHIKNNKEDKSLIRNKFAKQYGTISTT